MKIMIVEDEAAIRDAFGRRLRRDGHEVVLCRDGQDALDQFADERPHLVIIDIIMPGGLSGLMVCKRIREIADTPIMLVSAQAFTEDDVINGLNAGADEYLIKPIPLNEFAARVGAILRRAQITPSDSSQYYDDGYLRVDLHNRYVYVAERKVHLTPTEFKLLAVLIENAGRVVHQQNLLEQVWGHEYVDDIYYPRVYISQLRRKIERDPARPLYILTEHRIGYRFEKHSRFNASGSPKLGFDSGE